jgi:hypothetical protein
MNCINEKDIDENLVKIDSRLSSICEKIIGMSSSFYDMSKSIKEKSLFDEKDERLYYFTEILIRTYRSALALGLFYGDTDSCASLVRMSLEIAAPFILISRNSKALKEFIKFADFEMKSSHGDNSELIEYAKTHDGIYKKPGILKYGYAKYGWADVIQKPKKGEYKISNLFDCIIEDPNFKSYDFKYIYSSFSHDYTHATYIFARYEINATLCRSLKVIIPILIYIWSFYLKVPSSDHIVCNKCINMLKKLYKKVYTISPEYLK